MSRDYSRPITTSPSDHLISDDHLFVVLNTTTPQESLRTPHGSSETAWGLMGYQQMTAACVSLRFNVVLTYCC